VQGVEVSYDTLRGGQLHGLPSFWRSARVCSGTSRQACIVWHGEVCWQSNTPTCFIRSKVRVRELEQTSWARTACLLCTCHSPCNDF